MTETDDQSNADQPTIAVAAAADNSGDRPASQGWHYLLVALIAGLVSVLIGSSLVTAWIVMISNEPPHEYLAIIWGVVALYSGMFVLPVAIALGWPLMVFLRYQSNWVWLVISAVVAVSLAGILYVVFTGSKFTTLAPYTLTYGVCFGLAAACLRNWLVPRSL